MKIVNSASKYLIALLIVFAQAGFSHAEEFIKYKSYLIPVGNDCPEIAASVKRVLYIDDGGVRSEDPNGVQDLAIVLGLDVLHSSIKLVAIGSTSNKSSTIADNSYDLFVDIVEETGSTVSVFRDGELTDEIIRQAKCADSGSNHRLIIAIGGEWDAAEDALDEDDSISSSIKVIGIGGSNTEDPTALNSIITYIGGANVEEIDEGGGGSDSGFRDVFEVETTGTYANVSSLDSFYNSNLQGVLDGVSDSSGFGLTAQSPDWATTCSPINQACPNQNGWYIDEVRRLNNGQAKGGNSSSTPSDHKLRIADFLTVAEVLWPNSDIFNKDFIFPKISSALSEVE